MSETQPRPEIVLEDLSDKTGMSTALLIRDDEECVCVAEFSRFDGDSAYLSVGDRPPLHIGPGLLLLAGMPQHQIDDYLSSPTLASEATPDVVSMDIEWTREAGYVRHSDDPGFGSLSVPVLNSEGQLSGALTVFASRDRFNSADLDEIHHAMTKASHRFPHPFEFDV